MRVEAGAPVVVAIGVVAEGGGGGVDGGPTVTANGAAFLRGSTVVGVVAEGVAVPEPWRARWTP